MPQIKCLNCGKSNNDINDWCTGCKVDLKKTKVINTPVTVCRLCGKINVGAFQYCSFCGSYMSNVEMKSSYEKEETVLARQVADLPATEALFYAKENNLLNKDLYLKKIYEIEWHLRRYKDMLASLEAHDSAVADNAVETVDNTKAVLSAGKQTYNYVMGDPKPQEHIIVEEKAAADKNKTVSSAVSFTMKNTGTDFDTASQNSAVNAGGKSLNKPAANSPERVKEAFSATAKEHFSDNIMFSQLKPKIEDRINAEDEYTLSLYGSSKTPAQIALLITVDVIFEEFSKSGDCFLFKSVLSMKGKEFLRAWDMAVKALLDNGGYSKAEFDEAMQRINDILQPADK